MRVVGQRRHGCARRQGHHRRSAELSRQPLSRRADRHHGGRRQHRHPQPHSIRPGRDPLPSLSAEGNDGAAKTPTARAVSTPSTKSSGRMSATASPMRCAPAAAPGPAACLRRRPMPAQATQFYRQLGRHAAAFALAVDLSLLTLGGALKRKEMISARFGDHPFGALSLERGAQALERRRPPAGRLPAARLVHGQRASPPSRRASTRSSPISRVRPVAWLLRVPDPAARTAPPRSVRPLSPTPAPRSYRSMRRARSPDRRPLSSDRRRTDNGVALERAFALIAAVQPLRDRMRTARVRDIDQAVQQRTINADEAAQLKAAADAVAAAIAVDDFAPEELTREARQQGRA